MGITCTIILNISSDRNTRNWIRPCCQVYRVGCVSGESTDLGKVEIVSLVDH